MTLRRFRVYVVIREQRAWTRCAHWHVDIGLATRCLRLHRAAGWPALLYEDRGGLLYAVTGEEARRVAEILEETEE